MNFDKTKSIESEEKELEQVLRNFRQSVHAWSDAEYSRPRALASAGTHRAWRMALGWALGCVLAVGSVAGGLLERHHQQTLARMAADHEAQQQHAKAVEKTAAPVAQEEQIAAVEPSTTDEDLLAAVDSDVSRQVPSAMEPLAQLMENDTSR
jgi:hypothetical protein